VCVCTLAVLKGVVLRCAPRRLDSLYPRVHFVVANLCGCTPDAVRHHLWARTPTDDAVAGVVASLQRAVMGVSPRTAFKFLELGTWNLSETWKSIEGEQVHVRTYPDQTLKQLLTSRLTRSLLICSWLTGVPTLVP
jgi:hypothetical protein